MEPDLKDWRPRRPKRFLATFVIWDCRILLKHFEGVRGRKLLLCVDGRFLKNDQKKTMALSSACSTFERNPALDGRRIIAKSLSL